MIKEIIMTVELMQKFQTPDGKTFDTRAEAMEHVRRPQIKAALMTVCNNREDLAELLVDNREDIAGAFDVGRVRVVKKRERKLYAEALDHAVKLGGKEFKFIADHLEDLIVGFRWPKTTRMTEEERSASIVRSLVALTDGNEKLAEWIVANKDAVLGAFEAGKVKRAVDPKASAGLEAYRAKKAAEKAALAAQAE